MGTSRGCGFLTLALYAKARSDKHENTLYMSPASHRAHAALRAHLRRKRRSATRLVECTYLCGRFKNTSTPYMHAHTYTCMHAYIHASMHPCIHPPIQLSAQPSMHAKSTHVDSYAYVTMYMHMQVQFMHVCMHVYIYIYIYVCMHSCMHACMDGCMHVRPHIIQRMYLPNNRNPRNGGLGFQGLGFWGLELEGLVFRASGCVQSSSCFGRVVLELLDH